MMSLGVACLAPGDALCAADASPRLMRFERASLCVTNGTILALPNGRLAIDSPSSRAVVRAATAQDARVLFQYLGPTKDSKLLASGVLRRQIGIKLRAQDSCNLVYAMWHIDPDTRIAVAIKRNEGQHAHSECGARGYTYLTPERYRSPPPITPDQTHELRATLKKDGALTVLVDSQAVWEGNVGAQLGAIDGPVGIRTDNARFELEFFADTPPNDAPRIFDPLAFYHCEAGPPD